jgi:hypothetical protein
MNDQLVISFRQKPAILLLASPFARTAPADARQSIIGEINKGPDVEHAPPVPSFV